MVWYQGSGVAGERWLHADHLGSIVAMTNTSGGSPAINSYDEYGIPASTNSGRFQYTGQAWLSELGLYHYKARFYSPTLGRFLQTDPIGYDDQINLYAYVGNDPMNKTDPTGNAGWDTVQEALDWVGFTPAGVVTDPANAVISAARGNWGDAAINLAAAVPVIGDAVKGADKAVDTTKALKSLKPSTPIGARVKTPENSPGSFKQLKGGQGQVDKKTGVIMQKSHTNHSKSEGGEWKAGPRPGVPPTKSNKDTISGGKDGGCLLK